MKLLELKRQMSFVHQLNKCLTADRGSSYRATIQAGNANNTNNANNQNDGHSMLNLNDQLLRLALLPKAKFAKVIELAVLLLVYQDKSLALSGKKQLELAQIFSPASHKRLSHYKLDHSPNNAEARIISLALLQLSAFTNKSSYLICERLYSSRYPAVYQNLMLSNNWSTLLPEAALMEYWQSFSLDILTHFVLAAFQSVCRTSYMLQFSYIDL